MARISEVMTRGVEVISPDASLQHAAQLMDELNVGALPVCKGKELIGSNRAPRSRSVELPIGQRLVAPALADSVDNAPSGFDFIATEFPVLSPRYAAMYASGPHTSRDYQRDLDRTLARIRSRYGFRERRPPKRPVPQAPQQLALAI